MYQGQDDDLVQAAVIASRLSLSRAMVYRLAERGEIPHYRPTAGSLRFRLSEVESWLKARRAGGDAA